MKKLLIISICLISLCFEAEAQLLEDNQSRLKTAKVKSSGFLFFRNKNKVKTSKGANQQKSKGNVNPRYSKGKVSFRNKGVTPRYSSGSPFRGIQYIVSPKYSSGSPFKSSQYKVYPRYSSGNPFKGVKNRTSPRYSSGMPFSKSGYRVTPRYSQGRPFGRKDYRVSPRYSQGRPFTRADFRVAPRYSAGNPFRGVKWKVEPRYSSSKHRFDVNKRASRWANYDNQGYYFRLNWKLRKRGPGDQHPSSNYHTAMKFSNPKIRKMFRKWNAYWVRINRNKEEPNGVKASVRSPKFDKKEKDIWNN